MCLYGVGRPKWPLTEKDEMKPSPSMNLMDLIEYEADRASPGAAAMGGRPGAGATIAASFMELWPFLLQAASDIAALGHVPTPSDLLTEAWRLYQIWKGGGVTPPVPAPSTAEPHGITQRAT
jgi:hypothetical protein